jgi:hypothetical protein
MFSMKLRIKKASLSLNVYVEVSIIENGFLASSWDPNEFEYE